MTTTVEAQTRSGLIRSFEDLAREDVAFAGGKGANLGELTRAGFSVPAGFVVGAAAYDLFVDTLASRGRRVETVTVSDERAGLALVAAGQATLVTADHTLTADGIERARAVDPPLPLRLRVVWDSRHPDGEETERTARLLVEALSLQAASLDVASARVAR